MQKVRELAEEIRQVVLGRSNLVDVILPTLVYLALDRLSGFTAALWGALLSAAGFALYRVFRKQSPIYSLVGLGLAALATFSALWSGSPQMAFLPDLLTNGLTALGAILSNLFGRPLAGLSSHLTRGWHLDWYRHPRVIPAYREVTWFWAAFFGAKFAYQLNLYASGGSASSLAASSLLLGWPALIVVLVISYLYGIWRLQRLGGPSLDEFLSGAPAPWKGQARGF